MPYTKTILNIGQYPYTILNPRVSSAYSVCSQASAKLKEAVKTENTELVPIIFESLYKDLVKKEKNSFVNEFVQILGNKILAFSFKNTENLCSYFASPRYLENYGAGPIHEQPIITQLAMDLVCDVAKKDTFIKEASFIGSEKRIEALYKEFLKGQLNTANHHLQIYSNYVAGNVLMKEFKKLRIQLKKEIKSDDPISLIIPNKSSGKTLVAKL